MDLLAETVTVFTIISVRRHASQNEVTGSVNLTFSDITLCHDPKSCFKHLQSIYNLTGLRKLVRLINKNITNQYYYVH